jgi:AcrR family transcriptional regulator
MGRPHTPLLDRDRIAAAALKLTDRRGDFTILNLARTLKVTPAAIYHHVDGRGGIITLMREKMARTVDASGFGQLPWDQALRRWAVSYRETFAAHPGAIGMLAAEPVADPAVHALYEQAVTALQDAGFPGHEVLAVITAAESFVLGSALDLAAPPVMVSGIDADATPRLAKAAAAAPSGRGRADQAFHLGLDALITGLRCTLSQADDADAGHRRHGSEPTLRIKDIRDHDGGPSTPEQDS